MTLKKTNIQGMRIACVITRSDAIGGAHVHVADVVDALRDRQADVRVFVGGKGAFTELLERRGIAVASLRHLRRELSPLHDLSAFWELRSALKRFEPDLIVCHSAKAGLLARLVGRSLKIPTVFTAHGWSFTDGVAGSRRAIYLALERATAPLADRIITVSDYDRELALQCKVGVPSRVVCVHNGVPDVSPALHADPTVEPPRLVSVARLEEQKDHISLLRALSALKHLPWELSLVGDGPLEGEVQRLVQELGMESRVKLLGLRDDVPELLSRMQCFILASRWEGLPLSIIEAMRAGLPVVASDVGGVSELVKHEETGYLVPRDNVDQMRLYIESLLNDPSKRQAMGRAGRKRYEDNFHFDRMMEKTIAVYLEALHA